MGKGAQQVAEQPPPEPASAASAKASIGRWVVDGEEYDLTEFIPKHPGGMDMFVWANGRDITIPVYTYHKDPARTVLPLLKKYKVRTPAGVKLELAEASRAFITPSLCACMRPHTPRCS